MVSAQGHTRYFLNLRSSPALSTHLQATYQPIPNFHGVSVIPVVNCTWYVLCWGLLLLQFFMYAHWVVWRSQNKVRNGSIKTGHWCADPWSTMKDLQQHLLHLSLQFRTGTKLTNPVAMNDSLLVCSFVKRWRQACGSVALSHLQALLVCFYADSEIIKHSII